MSFRAPSFISLLSIYKQAQLQKQWLQKPYQHSKIYHNLSLQSANTSAKLSSLFFINCTQSCLANQIYNAMQLIDNYCYSSQLKHANPAQLQLNSHSLANEIKKRLEQRYSHSYHMTSISNTEQLDYSFIETDTLIVMFMHQKSNQLYDFQLVVCFNITLQQIQIKGHLSYNGIPVGLQSFSRISLGLNMVANFNEFISPVKICLHPMSGSLWLQANVFMEQASKQNEEVICELTNKIIHLINSIEQSRPILFFLLEEKLSLPPAFAKRYPKLVEQFQKAEIRISTLQSSLYTMNLDIFDNQRSINYELKRKQFSNKYQPFTEQTEQVLSLFTENLHSAGPNLSKLSNEHYGDRQIQLCKGELQHKIQSHILTRVYLIENQKWVIWNSLSSGGYGKIQVAQVKVNLSRRDNSQTIQQIDLKIIRKSDKKKQKDSRVVHQKQIIKNLKDKSHPNIASFLEVIPIKIKNHSPDQIADYLRNQPYVYLQFEYNTSLDSFLRRNQSFSLYSKIFTLEQAAKGLLFLHKENIVHIDFKPANIFISKHCLAKIGDFGQSLHLGTPSTYQSATTFPYYPPELKQLKRDSQPTQKADVYSFGVTLFECVFESNVRKPMQERDSLIKNSGNSYVELPYIQPQRIKEYGNKRVISILSFLCLRCLNVDPKQRPSMSWIVTILENCRFYLELLIYQKET